MEECVKVMVKSPSQTACLMEECVKVMMSPSPDHLPDGGVYEGGDYEETVLDYLRWRTLLR
jgi:hypothetical protein